MNIFGVSILPAEVFDEILEMAVSDKVRVNTLKEHKKILMRDKEELEGRGERLMAYNGILQDENTSLKGEAKKFLETGSKGIARMATKIRDRDTVIKNQAGIIKDKVERNDDLFDITIRRDDEIIALKIALTRAMETTNAARKAADETLDCARECKNEVERKYTELKNRFSDLINPSE